ncbi:MAG: aldehyde dehydrogenase [Bacteroidia bacterium]|nr:MAG: aldehyde dehydrogenase [Bacteroidia bacterium]
MDKSEIENIRQAQRAFFASHQTKSYDFRLSKLKKLETIVKQNEAKISEALWTDLHKSKFEAYATEIGLVLDEISLHKKQLRKWTSPKKVKTPLSNFKGSSYIFPEPYGNALIISPWNYPFQLCISPLVGAISAGNTAVIKPSEFTPNTSQVIADLINSNFKSAYIHVVEGNYRVNQKLLAEKWDYIFFTGSPKVGQIVMQAAARHLTPLTLELGGKSPVIVDEKANLEIAAKRIVWGKFLNAGQTCIAPDYLFVHEAVKEKFISLLRNKIELFYGKNPKESRDFPRISTEKHCLRLLNLLKNQRIIAGGDADVRNKFLAPTLVESPKLEDSIMQEEIFGPILPILPFKVLDDVIGYINKNPKPLAIYYFSEKKYKQKKIVSETSSGGVCINDVVMHIANHHLPFGGVGNSGLGSYHGKFSFDTFSHKKSVLRKSTRIDIPMRYAPYNAVKLKMLKFLFK